MNDAARPLSHEKVEILINQIKTVQEIGSLIFSRRDLSSEKSVSYWEGQRDAFQRVLVDIEVLRNMDDHSFEKFLELKDGIVRGGEPNKEEPL